MCDGAVFEWGAIWLGIAGCEPGLEHVAWDYGLGDKVGV